VRVTTWDHSRKLHYRIQRGGTSKGLATSESVTKRTRRGGGMGNFVQRTLWKDKLTSGSKGDASVWLSGVLLSCLINEALLSYWLRNVVRSCWLSEVLLSYWLSKVLRSCLISEALLSYWFRNVVRSYWLSEVLLSYWLSEVVFIYWLSELLLSGLT
jgi:hypothetical protein